MKKYLFIFASSLITCFCSCDDRAQSFNQMVDYQASVTRIELVNFPNSGILNPNNNQNLDLAYSINSSKDTICASNSLIENVSEFPVNFNTNCIIPITDQEYSIFFYKKIKDDFIRIEDPLFFNPQQIIRDHPKLTEPPKTVERSSSSIKAFIHFEWKYEGF